MHNSSLSIGHKKKNTPLIIHNIFLFTHILQSQRKLLHIYRNLQFLTYSQNSKFIELNAHFTTNYPKFTIRKTRFIIQDTQYTNHIAFSYYTSFFTLHTILNKRKKTHITKHKRSNILHMTLCTKHLSDLWTVLYMFFILKRLRSRSSFVYLFSSLSHTQFP